MKRYILIGAYEKEEMENKAKCIDLIYSNNEKELYDNLETYIWEHHREDLEKYDLLFLVSDSLEIIGRVSSFSLADFMRTAIENDGDLKDYHPVYVDIAEYDERVLLSNILDINLV